jgi:hypothetical protein
MRSPITTSDRNVDDDDDDDDDVYTRVSVR